MCPLKEHILQSKLEMGVETLALISTSLSLQEKEEEEGRKGGKREGGKKEIRFGDPSILHSFGKYY